MVMGAPVEWPLKIPLLKMGDIIFHAGSGTLRARFATRQIRHEIILRQGYPGGASV